MTTAVIGTGSIGSTVIKDLVKGGENVIIASGTLEEAQELANQLGEKASAATTEDAIKQADNVLFAVWFDTTKELIGQYKDQLADKIVIDPSNPIAPDGKGGFVKTIPENESSGEILAGLLPESAKLVKAFGTLSADTLAKSSDQDPRVVLFYATNDKDAGDVVAKLITVAGFEPVYAGGLDQSIKLEVFGDLHEFGKLGKTVDREEALAALKNG